ncbi:MAG: hypothetical protein EA358_01000 [Flavobacteriales bacterium]|nr:MAG: hypothetical protein EA358_01000 [Flavobacteriales bacterium]
MCNQPARSFKWIVLLAAIALASCGTHRSSDFRLEPGEISVDTLRVMHLEARKSSRKMLVIFQPPNFEHTSNDFAKMIRPWKNRRYDVLLLEYPHPENAILSKNLSVLALRNQDYLRVLEPFREKGYQFAFFCIENASMYGLEVADFIAPKYVIVHRNVPSISPLDNIKLILNNDTLSTDKKWQPVDPSRDIQGSFDELYEAVTQMKFSGLLEFEGFNEKVWSEIHQYPFLQKIGQHQVIFTLQKNDFLVSKTALMILKSMYPNNIYQRESPEEEWQDFFEKILLERFPDETLKARRFGLF